MPARIVVALFCVAQCSGTTFGQTFPGKTWARKTPAEAGLNESKLDSFRRLAGGRGCIIHDGRLVYTWGDHTKRGDVASAAKPVYSYFLFKALEDKRIDRLDEKVARYEPQLAKLNAKLDYPDAHITWRHLANQTSCYGVTETPGTAFDYSDWQMALFWDLLFTKVYGADYQSVDERVLRPLLADVLQCEDTPTLMAFGQHNRPGRLAISPRDFARFGLLFLHQGRWNGQQLLSGKLAQLAVSSPLPLSIPRTQGRKADMLPGQRSIGGGNNQTDHNGGYSWLWWLNGVARDGKRWWKDAPDDMFLCLGHGGREGLAVMPSLKIIVSWNGHKELHSDRELGNRAFKLVVEAVQEKKVTVEDQPQPPPGRTTPTFSKWSPVELKFHGPQRQGRGNPNPFEVRLDVVFTSPSGNEQTVPGFYDGDGKGGLNGNVWKVRHACDETGKWLCRTRSNEKLLDGRRKVFSVGPVSAKALGFWKWGRLEAAGTPGDGIRYLKFRDGPYWLKAGCDDPENFLGSFKNYDTLEKRKAAVDFLAERGVNSMYIMLHNLGGDHRDVWPWLGETEDTAKQNAGANARFDVKRLEEWRQLFEHMQTVGVVPYLVLEDDSAFNRYDHERYYREIVARFGYLPAVLFNLGEEANENYSLKQGLTLLKQFRRIDPYRHPVGIHNVNRPVDIYIDAPQVDFTAIQTGAPGRARTLQFAMQHNQIAIDWITLCQKRKRRQLMIGFDEGRPEEDRRAWWSAYLGGAVWEAHVQEPYDRPLSAWEPVWSQLGGTRAFLESLPFWEMLPHNDLVVEGRGFCLAKPGEAYAVYLPTGGSIQLQLKENQQYSAGWWNPDQGMDGGFQDSTVVDGGKQMFTAPGRGDWALRIRRRRSIGR